MLDLFAPAYMQRALAEVLLLAVPAGVLGSWVILRRLAFFAHAVGSATFPGLVVAGPWGIAPPLAALGAALGFGAALERLARTRRVDASAATGLLLVGALAVGIVLASDVYRSGAGVDRLLFGSLIALRERDLVLTAAVAVLALAAHAMLGRTWLAAGFEPEGAAALGVRAVLGDRALLLAVAAAVVVSLTAAGALLVSVVLVVPAATVRLTGAGLRGQVAGTVALAACEGVGALALADALDVGPGPALAVLGGAIFAAMALAGRRG